MDSSGLLTCVDSTSLFSPLLQEIDILVNCAGAAQNSLFVRIGEAGVENMLNINLRSAIWGCRVVGKQMISRRSGCIINVSSLLAQRAVIGTSVYAATKAGQLGT